MTPPTDSPPTPPSDAPPTPPVPERRRGADRRAAREERRKQQVPVAVERRSGIDRRSLPGRRAQESKTAGAYDLDQDTLEFIRAVNEFKASSGKTFPALSEIMEIIRALGYSKPSA